MTSEEIQFLTNKTKHVTDHCHSAPHTHMHTHRERGGDSVLADIIFSVFYIVSKNENTLLK